MAGKIMLQDAKEGVICKLSKAQGRSVSVIDIDTLQAGSIIQITTKTGSIYLLETIHEHSEWVHFARFTQKGERSSGRYFGRQKLGSFILGVGQTFTHDNMVTKEITHIKLLCE